MTITVLTFSESAAKALGDNTRLRIKSMTRAGVELVALRPSYRVSGKNAQLRTLKDEAGVITAEMSDEIIASQSLPALAAGQYLFEQSGGEKYGWFALKEVTGEVDADAPLITIARVAKSAAPSVAFAEKERLAAEALAAEKAAAAEQAKKDREAKAAEKAAALKAEREAKATAKAAAKAKEAEEKAAAKAAEDAAKAAAAPAATPEATA